MLLLDFIRVQEEFALFYPMDGKMKSLFLLQNGYLAQVK